MKTRGNTVLITGGASGIGLALARALVGEDNRVLIAGRCEQKLADAQALCPELETLQTDITVESDRQRLLHTVGERFPTLNILVNNAAVAFFCDLQGGADPSEEIDKEMQTNFLAPVRLTQSLLPQLLLQPTAAVVNMTTAASYLPLTQLPGYSASKAALTSYTRSLRSQLAQTSVRVFDVVPPPVDTQLAARIHVRKMTPQRVAAHVLAGLRRDRLDIRVGNAWAAVLMARLAPKMSGRIVDRQMARAVSGSPPGTVSRSLGTQHPRFLS